MLVSMPSREELNINAIHYSLEHAALEVYVAGCTAPHCPGCHNKDLWPFDSGAPIVDWIPQINRLANEYFSLVDRVWILGGEPLDQDTTQLVGLLTLMKSRFPKQTIWLFTRYPKEETPLCILPHIDYIKNGAYKEELGKSEELHVDGIKITLGSKNQTIGRVCITNPDGKGSRWVISESGHGEIPRSLCCPQDKEQLRNSSPTGVRTSWHKPTAIGHAKKNGANI